MKEMNHLKDRYILGLEYNLNSDMTRVESVYRLTTYGKELVGSTSSEITVTDPLFENPFNVICENTPYRISFYYDTPTKEMLPDWYTNKCIITLSAYARLTTLIRNTDPNIILDRIDYTNPVVGHLTNKIEYNKTVHNSTELHRLTATGLYNLIKFGGLTLQEIQDWDKSQYGVFFSSLKYENTGRHVTDITSFKEVDLLNFPYVFSIKDTPAGASGGSANSLDPFYSIDKDTSLGFFVVSKMYVNMFSYDKLIPFFTMKKDSKLPNIEIDKFNVFL